MHIAARNGNDQQLASLIQAGQDVNQMEDPADTCECFAPIHYACSKGHLGCARLLVAAGCNVNILTVRSQEPRSPLTVLLSSWSRSSPESAVDRLEILRTLLIAGADQAVLSAFHHNIMVTLTSPITSAVMNGQVEIFPDLFALGATLSEALKALESLKKAALRTDDIVLKYRIVRCEKMINDVWDGRLVAFLMSKHQRAGQHSAVGMLPHDLVEMIALLSL